VARTTSDDSDSGSSFISNPVFGVLGVAANAGAVSAQLAGAGRLLVWGLVLGGLALGIAIIVDRWGRPFDRSAALAVTAMALGGVVLGVVIGEAGTRNAAEAAARPSTVTVSPDDPPPPVTTTTELTTPETTTTETTTPVEVSPRIAHSGSDGLFVHYGEYDIDEAGGNELDVADRSINAVNQAQFSVKVPADPTYADCAAIPAGQWRGSVPLEEFRDGAVYCLRTDGGQLGFLVVEEVELDGPTISNVYSHWTIWE